jgi:hypothetical protein
MAAPPPADGDQRRLEDRAPFFTWRGIYLLVLGALAAEVVLFALLTRGMR